MIQNSSIISKLVMKKSVKTFLNEQCQYSVTFRGKPNVNFPSRQLVCHLFKTITKALNMKWKFNFKLKSEKLNQKPKSLKLINDSVTAK